MQTFLISRIRVEFRTLPFSFENSRHASRGPHLTSLEILTCRSASFFFPNLFFLRERSPNTRCLAETGSGVQLTLNPPTHRHNGPDRRPPKSTAILRRSLEAFSQAPPIPHKAPPEFAARPGPPSTSGSFCCSSLYSFSLSPWPTPLNSLWVPIPIVPFPLSLKKIRSLEGSAAKA